MSTPSSSDLTNSGHLPRLQASGKWLTATTGEVVILRGFNLVSKTSATPEQLGFGEENARFLAARGVSVMRLGVIWCNVEPYLKPDGSDGDYELAYLESLKRTITLLGRHGIYTLVDFHQDGYSEPWGFGAPAWARVAGGTNTAQAGFPACVFGGATLPNVDGPVETDCDIAMDEFWYNHPIQNIGLQDHFGDMVAHVVGFLSDCGSDILGYDPHNEPTPGSAWIEAWPDRDPGQRPSGPCTGFDTNYLGSFYATLLPRIRAADPDAIIWFEPNMLYGLGVPTAVPLPDLPNVGFNFHNYDAGSAFADPIAYATTYQADNNVPLLNSEYGATTDATTIETVCALNDTNLLSSIFWAWFNNPRFNFYSTSQLPSDPRSQGVARDMAAPLEWPNVNTVMLDALTRVYPRSIAGTPITFRYEPVGRMFHLEYTNEPVTGVAGGNVTRIVVPASVYPDGFTVNVTNGTVVSQVLPFVDIAAAPWEPGATVTVTVDIVPPMLL